MPQLPRSRLEVALVAGGLVLGLIGAGLSDSKATRATALTGLAEQGLDELAELAGLADERGRPLREDRFPVRALSEEVDAAAAGALSTALREHPNFSEDENSEHVARIEVIESDTAMVAQLRLWRQGWDLRTSSPARTFVVPFRVWLVTIVGLLAMVWMRRYGLTAVALGALAQVSLLGVRWPEGSPLVDAWSSNVRHGPLAKFLAYELRRIPDAGVAMLAAFVAFCLVLVWFDHRRSTSSKADIGLVHATLTALGLSLGVIAWLEAAWRSAALASLSSGGAIAAFGASLLVVAAVVGRVTHPPRDGPTGGGTTPDEGTPRRATVPSDDGEALDAPASPPSSTTDTPDAAAPTAPTSGGLPLALLASLLALSACGGDEREVTLETLRARVERAIGGDTVVSVATVASPAPVASVSTTDAWMDLVAQRPSALVIRSGRLVIDPAQRAIVRHLDPSPAVPFVVEEARGDVLAGELLAGGGPMPRTGSDGPGGSPVAPAADGAASPVEAERVALLRARSVALWFPLDGALAPSANPDVDAVPQLAMALELRALMPKQYVTVFLNETPVVNLDVPETWHRRTISLPLDKVTTGENVVRLHFRHVRPDDGASVAMRALEVGRRTDIVEGPAAVGGWTASPSRSGAVSLSLSPDTSLVYYVIPPRRGRLRLDAHGAGTLDVRVSTDQDHAAGTPPDVLASVTLDADSTPMDLDLSGYGGVPIRLELHFAGAHGAPLSLDRAEIAVSRARPKDNRARRPRDVYVLAVEGLRYDDFVGPRLGGVPLENFDRLRRDSLFFTGAHAIGAAAVPSQAGIMSSMVPAAHLTPRGTFVAESRVTLADAFARSGFGTAAVVANADISEERGLSQGFDEHRVLLKGVTGGNTATQVVDALLEQRTARDSPRFLWATFSDPQAPYNPPVEWVADLPAVEGVPPSHTTHMWIYKVARGTVVSTPAQIEHVRRLYVGELRHVDAAVGRLVAALERDGTLGSSIVVLVGVHGEEFLDHGGMGHGATLHEESVHVPLLIHAPELLAPGRVTTPVDLLDLGPTLADLAGLNPAQEWQGESLVPVIDDPVPPPRSSIASMGDGSRAVWVDRYKAIVGPGQGVASWRLFDVVADPSEQGPLPLGPVSSDTASTGRGIVFRVLRTALAWELPDQTRWKRARWGTGANLAPAFAIDHGM